ncbi:hypothetical protein HUT18_11480 [Streptomyces sp. NA04227]|uniref:hypothetical protein n=1 Tax=Streptomyces sp. NA04227 TaxID=2742136 RepID=UPI001591DF04|nr:hypothetical protein [Streptomyces sp. NA04227]QKW06920.1 hypothetical protein HUT18_11480 [Streptomyces sp. NA04227]
MAMDGYLALGGVELANSARLEAYLQSVGSPLADAGTCACPTFTAEMVGDLPYTNPADDGAPWYDPDVPESAEFTGFLVLSVDGLDDYPMRRSVTNAVTGGAALGPARAMPRTITITGILLGATCCAVEYGLHWLAEAMTGCTGGTCDGDCLQLFSCCPGEEETPEEFRAHRLRTYRRVALTQGPTVTARHGDGCTSGECSAGADVLTVEIVLTAATPWAWTDPTPILDVPLPGNADDNECVVWCVTGQAPQVLCVETRETCRGSLAAPVVNDDAACDLAWPTTENPPDQCDGVCRLAACEDPTIGCADPSCAPPAPPQPAALDTCFCLALAVETECLEMDLTDRPAWSVDVPMISLRAGADDLRNVTITFYERPPGGDDLTCDEVAEFQRCEPHSQYTVAYVPAGGSVLIDGQIGRAIVECGGQCETSRDVYGYDGAPPSFTSFECANFCVCVETDALNPPAEDARLTLSVSGRGY